MKLEELKKSLKLFVDRMKIMKPNKSCSTTVSNSGDVYKIFDYLLASVAKFSDVSLD